MSNDRNRLQRLQRVAGVLAEQALLPVKKATENVRQLEGRIAEIAHHRAQLATSTADPSIAGAMLDQAERLRKQQMGALTELAAARVTLEKARKAAAKAVGKDQVLGKIADKKQANAELEARRRMLR